MTFFARQLLSFFDEGVGLPDRYPFHRFYQAFPPVIGMAPDVIKDIVKYSAPVAFGSETAGYF